MCAFSLLWSITGILSSVCVLGMLCAGYSSGVVDAKCVLSACCGLLLEYCRLCVSQACSVPATPLVGWMLARETVEVLSPVS
jgi:hypothetical protein